MVSNHDPCCSSRIRMLAFSHPGSRIQGSKRHPIPDPDPQHWEKVKKLTKECEACGKRFEKNWKLKRHMVVHTKDIISKAEVVAEEQMFIVTNDAKFETVEH